MLKPDRLKRKNKIRSKLKASASTPRVTVYKSNSHIYAQVIDDTKNITLASSSDSKIKAKKANKTEISALVGEELGKKVIALKIKQVLFDRSGYKYHGRVKALADGIRKAGVKI